MIAVLDPPHGQVKYFDELTLSELKTAHNLAKLDLAGVERVGIILRHLPEDLIRLDLASNLTLETDEEHAVTKTRQALDQYKIWLVSNSSFFRDLPYEARLGISPAQIASDGLIHADLADKAKKMGAALESGYLTLTAHLDSSSSIAVLGGGRPVDYLADLPTEAELLKMAGFSRPVAEILAKPKLRANPEFRLALKFYQRQIVLAVAALAKIYSPINMVILSGAMIEKSDEIRGSVMAIFTDTPSTQVFATSAEPARFTAGAIRNL